MLLFTLYRSFCNFIDRSIPVGFDKSLYCLVTTRVPESDTSFNFWSTLLKISSLAFGTGQVFHPELIIKFLALRGIPTTNHRVIVLAELY